MEPEHLSYSSVSMYQTCPRSWWYRYSSEAVAPVSPNLVFGSAFHKTIENHLLKKSEGVSLFDRWAGCWDDQLKIDSNIAWDKSQFEYERLGGAMLSVPDVIKVIDNIEPAIHNEAMDVELRVEFRVPGVSVPIIGYIDVVEEDMPADFKTSSRPWTQKKADDELQPEFYLAALEQMGYWGQSKFRYYIFVKNPPGVQVIETYRTLNDREQMFSVVREVWDAIKNETFPPNPHTWKCDPRWCEFYEDCRGGNRKIRFKRGK